MTGRELYDRLRGHYADNGTDEIPWEDTTQEEKDVWELLANGVVDRAALAGAFDRIGGVPDRNGESPEAFAERVEAGDAHRIAFDVALILTEEA
jgi:hypothetical protein